ncbi:uncharacterized protein LOC120420473 [Culex pipiens pallens]|uniref:uncharacterized protein LOC120420473 n=1 Tax=Culex pipiens pallens TaxID=42434 RepID=UPI0019549BF1|nr:uncharacterized protein LOC120420473 [Culex pipiens pallens]
MGRTKKENPKKVKTTAKSAQQKRSRKAGAEPQERQKKQQSAAKTVNDSALKLKLDEKLQKSGISLSQNGLEMVSIPSGAFIENCPGPSTSKDPLNLSVTAVPEAATKNGSLSLMTSDEEDDSQEGDGDYDDGSTSEEETLDKFSKLHVHTEVAKQSAAMEEDPFPMPIKAEKTPPRATPQPENDALTYVNMWKNKFLHQLEQTKELSNSLLKEKAKSSRLNQLVVTQMAMIRELRLGKETSVFTTEAGVDITVSEMEDISSQSKHAADFAQRLAVFFYGTEGLRTMKVTTKGGQAMKPISPKKLKFIHNKARQHVAKVAGLDAYEKISIEANAATLNKALAEKIQNLRKAQVLKEAHGNNVFN